MKKRVHISECTNSEVLAEDIINRYGAVILASGTVINEYIVNKLIDFGIESILVFEMENDQSSFKNYHLFETKYKNSIDEMKYLMLEIIRGGRVDYSVISNVSNSVISACENPEHVIKCLGKIRDADNYTYFHCVNVSFYAMLIGGWLNLAREDIKTLIQAALLHDLGKTKIPNELLNKKEKLSVHEFQELKKHAVYGYEMAKCIPGISEEILDVILMHHEREDKSGYPLHAGADDLSIFTKIVAVADVYDAMTSNRSYRKALTPFEAFEEFYTVCRGRMDMQIVNILLNNLSRYYTGSRVLLNNGQTANIAYIPPQCIWMPIVDIGSGFLDLSREKEISIASMA